MLTQYQRINQVLVKLPAEGLDQSSGDLNGNRDAMGWEEGWSRDVGIEEQMRPANVLRLLQTSFPSLQLHNILRVDHPYNATYPYRRIMSQQQSQMKGLFPSRALKFAVAPASYGTPTHVLFEQDWLMAWHGCSLHLVPEILRTGLRGESLLLSLQWAQSGPS
uniref:Uncharacterized protein n=1 Tax=Chromera velia CCMP2878 TaxID=1169474 RepID=A0A0G4HL17_9ALVE|eukprot:Cvel_7370.t1-p1 / transcript=Cvel_7370.t1 / gene=Cvel_7370 / organism=Chromera_velia_CCMP2878 / gene_product=hypothetical protein / transcript_product=hypothetical protein / location=Cvel_scaffold383:62589-63074(+) / protein_length=162 / sequence_SO=supercontig / SO=protein_coding / is_pseudo=false